MRFTKSCKREHLSRITEHFQYFKQVFGSGSIFLSIILFIVCFNFIDNFVFISV